MLPETSRRLQRLAWIFFLPLVLLAGIGGYYLTEDRRLAHQKAQADAHEFLRAVNQQIGLSNALSADLRLEDEWFWEVGAEVKPEAIIYRDWDGNDLSPLPEKTNNAEFGLPKLSGDLFKLWRSAEEAEFRQEPKAGVAGYDRFLEAGPPLEYVFEARYRKAVLTFRVGAARRALEEIESLIRDCPRQHPVHRRAQWFRVTKDPLASDQYFKAACSSWTMASNGESRAMLEKVAEEAVWKDQADVLERWTGIMQPARQRIERETRARKLSPRIPNRLSSGPDWKLQAYLVDNRPQDLFVMRSRAPTKKGHLLVAWTQAQLGRRISPLLTAENLDGVRRPDTVNMVMVALEGRGIWGHSWPTRAQRKLFSADSGADLKMAPIATNMVAGFQIVASAAPGVIVWESNLRMAWFLLLMLFAGAISVSAWKFARKSLLHLDALNQEKSNFVSSVSHELRAPVASMQLMAESLHTGKVGDEDKQREYFSMILQECRRLGALVHNVLDFARIEQQRKEYEFSSCNLAELIEHTVSLMEPSADERGIRLCFDGTQVEAEVDEAAIQQALINLLDNAIKFSPTKSEVTVGLSELDGGGARIAVSDRGPGVPADQQEKIFEQFYRRENELRRETKGVGIGLSIVKHVVEAHGGRVQVSTNEFKGAVFVIEIPNRKEEKDDVANSAG